MKLTKHQKLIKEINENRRWNQMSNEERYLSYLKRQQTIPFPKFKDPERENDKAQFFSPGMQKVLGRERWIEEGIKRGYLTPEGNMVKD